MHIPKKQCLMLVGFFLLILSIVLFPLFKPGFIITDDADWMVIRLSSFYQSLADGQFPVRFLGRLNYNYGYPVANFLYPGFLYIGSFLHVLGMPVTTTVEFLMAASVAVGGIGIYCFLVSIFGLLPGTIGAISFVLSPYLLFDMYKRGSVGELLAIAVTALGLWVIEKKALRFFPFLIFFLIISHNTLAILLGAFLIGYALFVKKEKKILFPLGIGVLMSSFFWIPALFEQRFVDFNRIAVANPFHFFNDSMTLLLWGIPFILAFIFLYKQKEKQIPGFLFFSVVFLLATWLATPLSSPFWNLPILSRLVQFPYRFFSLWLFAGPWFIAYACYTMHKKKQLFFVVGFGFMLLVIAGIQLFNVKSIVREEGYYTTNEGTTTVSSEYMPRWVVEKPDKRSNEKIEFFSGKGTIDIKNISTKKIEAIIIADEDSVLQVNTVFYPGWGGTLDDKPVELSYRNSRGLMHIMVPKGEHRVLVEFRETAFRFFADVLSAIGIFLYGFYILSSFLRIKKNKSFVSWGDICS